LLAQNQESPKLNKALRALKVFLRRDPFQSETIEAQELSVILILPIFCPFLSIPMIFLFMVAAPAIA
jgi:hypothetical protein